MKRILDGVEVEMTNKEIAEFEQSRVIQFSIESFTQELVSAFDAKFEAYWKAKGYSDLSDLNSHSVDTKSIHHQEALSLIRWSNSSWEIAVSGLNENSNIDEIINNLPIFE